MNGFGLGFLLLAPVVVWKVFVYLVSFIYTAIKIIWTGEYIDDKGKTQRLGS